MQLQIKKVNPNAIIPTRNNPTDSGLDLYACLDNDVVIESSALIPTGIAIKLPEPEQYSITKTLEILDNTRTFAHLSTKTDKVSVAYEAQIRPISIQGLLVHWGTYHLPYTGEIKVCLYNLTNQPVVIKHGMRIAQLVIAPVFLPDLIECDFDVTGINGFDK